MDDRQGFGWAGALTVISLVATGLFYLQFGRQPLVHHVPQAALSLVGATAIA